MHITYFDFETLCVFSHLRFGTLSVFVDYFIYSHSPDFHYEAIARVCLRIFTFIVSVVLITNFLGVIKKNYQTTHAPKNELLYYFE